MAVAADLMRSENELSLKAGDAVGDCHARRLPSVHEAQWLQAEKDSGVKIEGQDESAGCISYTINTRKGGGITFRHVCSAKRRQFLVVLRVWCLDVDEGNALRLCNSVMRVTGSGSIGNTWRAGVPLGARRQGGLAEAHHQATHM